MLRASMVLAACLMAGTALAGQPQGRPYSGFYDLGWQSYQPSPKPHPGPSRRPHRASHRKAAPSETAVIAKLKAELAAIRKEVRDLRVRWDRPWDSVPNPFTGPAVPMPRSEAEEATGAAYLLAALPDLRAPLPSLPPPTAPARTLEAIEEVRIARLYLIKTATIGGTMGRQGVDVAIGRLHPGFVVRLAEAIKRARAEGIPGAGVFSAYRPPAYGVGGFGDKFRSLHAYGLAVDIEGIKTWAQAKIWRRIVEAVGLFLPYPGRWSERNHTQFVPQKVASSRLRATITAIGPKDLHAMWLASGVKQFVDDVATVSASAKLLPEVDWK